MNFKELFDGIKKSVREGLERLDEKTLANNVINKAVSKVQNKLFGDMIASETQAEIEYEYANYYIEQLLSEMQELALMAAKYNNMCETFTSDRTDRLANLASTTSKDLEKAAKEIAKRILNSVNSEVAVENQRAVLENICYALDELSAKCNNAIIESNVVKANLDVRSNELNEYKNWEFAADATKKAFYEKAEEAQALESELPAIELRLRQY